MVTANDVYAAQIRLADAEAKLREEKLMLAYAETQAEFKALDTDLGTNDTIRKIKLAQAVAADSVVTGQQASVLEWQHAIALRQAELDLVKGERRDQDAERQWRYIEALERQS